MRARRRPPRAGLLRALEDRALGTSHPSHFRSSLYAGLVPSSTFINVSGVPSVAFRRFTPCGRFLVAISRNQRDLVLFRLESGARRPLPAEPLPGLDFDRPACPPRQPPPPPSDLWLAGQQPPSSSMRPNFDSPFLQDPASRQHCPFAPPIGHPPFASAGLHNERRTASSHPLGLLSTLPVPLVGAGAASSAVSPEPGATRAASARRREILSQKFSCHFSRFFTKMYQVPVALSAETLVPEFCLATPRSKYLILASYQPRESDNNNGNAHVPQPPPVDEPLPAVASVPVLERFTLHLVNVESGVVEDRYTLLNDFVELEGHAGVHMHGDMLCVLSIRHQILHIIKVQENLGRFTQEGRIGAMCRPDDELEIARARDAENNFQVRKREEARQCSFESAAGSSSGGGLASFSRVDEPSLVRKRRTAVPNEGAAGGLNGTPPVAQQSPVVAAPTDTGLGRGKLKSGFYTGLMQRLLVCVYRSYYRDGNQSLFYRVVGQYSMLVMLKAQFLDNDHLLIRLGSREQGGKPPDPAALTCFFVVYCISSTNILNLFENRSTELLAIYEKYRDIFIGDAAVSATLPPPRAEMEDALVTTGGPGSNIPHRAENEVHGQGRSWSVRPGSLIRGRHATSKRTRAELLVLPVSCQTRNVSPFLDRQIFSYNADRIAALDGTRALSLRDLNTVKFISVRTGAMRFKLSPGLPAFNGGQRSRRGMDDGNDHTTLNHNSRKKKALFLFHPHYPFVMSMEYNLVSPTTYNFHVHGFRE